VEEGAERLALVSAELVGRADEVADDVAEHEPVFLDSYYRCELAPSFRMPFNPPVQRPQTCSAGLEAASGPAPRGAFCFGLLTATCTSGPVKASQTPFVSKPHDFFGLGSEP